MDDGTTFSHEEIVISGISGRFPGCDSVEEFKQKLLDGVDMVRDDHGRWPPGYRGTPTRLGTLKNIKEFDADFFGIYAKQAHAIDPQQRLLLETTFEAILDAGVNPNELRGSEVGVFVGIWQHEGGEYWKGGLSDPNPYSLVGSGSSMIANRISYVFDFNGPSYVVDSACSSSLTAMYSAMTAIRSGDCDSAIVGGANICALPQVSQQFQQIGMLNQEGKCRMFDSSGNGFVRAEATVSIYLQKASSARRIYASVLGISANSDGYKEKGIIYPSAIGQYNLMNKLYQKLNVGVSEVTYFEAHGTGTKAGDPEEGDSVAKLFCNNRKEPLLIGSVKSNMGHSEAAASFCSIAKVIIAMEYGVIPGNLHYQNPNVNISALFDGRLKVVTKNEQWDAGITGISSFGIGGANAHVVLRPNHRRKKTLPVSPIPRLVTVSGRTNDAVAQTLVEIEQQKDPEFFALLNKIHSSNVKGHGFRGYSILGKGVQEVNEAPSSQRPIWFVYSGMGSQWCAMGEKMMQLEPFRTSIERSASVLSKHGVDLMNLLLDTDETHLQHAVFPLVSITSIQIALTDVLRVLGIEPDGIVGHSVGEIACGYGDGSLTAEQAVLASYFRSNSFLEANLPAGLMAAVGLTWEECKNRCPSDISLACHNAKDNVTVAGPPDAIKKYIEQLHAEHIFAKVVKGGQYAYHTKYVASAGSKLLKSLKRIITSPKARSAKWISSSIPEANWKSSLAQTCSAEYYVNNLVSPVLFYDSLKHIPENAVVIEIAPHGLLLPVLKRALGHATTSLSLMKRDHLDNIDFFLSSIGKLFNFGCHPDLSKIYPSISFPVSRGTPMIAPLIKWDHSNVWDVPEFSQSGHRFGELITINADTEEYRYLKGHVIDGRVLFPGAGYLVLAWRTLSKLNNTDYEQMSVVFEDITFHRATIIPKSGEVKLLVNIFGASGEFEISQNDSLIASGKVSARENTDNKLYKLLASSNESDSEGMFLAATDIYTELRLRGYDYEGLFQGVAKSNSLSQGSLKWNSNWVTYIDTMMQFFELGKKTRRLYLPTGLQRVVINPLLHLELCSNMLDGVPVNSFHDLDIVKSGAIEISGSRGSNVQRRQHMKLKPKLEVRKFVPMHNTIDLEEKTRSFQQALTVATRIVLENIGDASKLKVLEIPGEDCLGPVLNDIIDAVPIIALEYFVVIPVKEQANDLEEMGANILRRDPQGLSIANGLHLVVLHNVIQNSRFLSTAIANLKPQGFVLLQEELDVDEKACGQLGLEVISVQRSTAAIKSLILLRKVVEDNKEPLVLQVPAHNFDWIEPLKTAMKKSEIDGSKIILVGQDCDANGLTGMVNCLKKEAGGGGIRSYILHSGAESFKTSSTFYAAQIKKDLVHNVLDSCNNWGTYRHLSFDTYAKSVQVQSAFITPATIGDVSSMRWVPTPPELHRGDGNIELCTVYYAGLNFRDVLFVNGTLQPDVQNMVAEELLLGYEFSGRDSTGRRVMGMLQRGGGMATRCGTKPELLLEVPKHWSLKEAATVPLVYATCYLAMIVRGQMQPGESILIHAGAGGVGYAAIAIALHMDCIVFTTVSSQAKKDFLKKAFPQLVDNHIGNSRDTSFEQLVLTQTNGHGVDLVLNSLAGEQLLSSVRCLGIAGRFLELGKVDLVNNTPLGLGAFMDNRSFSGIALDRFLLANSSHLKTIIRLVNEGILSGAVRPIPAVVFAEDEFEQAFKLMASGKHTGKILIEIRKEEDDADCNTIPKEVEVVPRTHFDAYKTYVIVGGLGGFGLELANWLVSRGATKILLTSRNGIVSGYQRLCIQRWEKNCISVVVSTIDACTLRGSQQLIQEANSLGPVGGIFNLALVLHDSLMQNQNEASFKVVYKPKVDITRNLDLASRDCGSSLEHFVMFSSAAGYLGNIGQSNYGFANSIAEQICELRHANGLPALAIQWGIIGDVGVAANLGSKMGYTGVLPQRMPSCLNTLDFFLQQPHPVVSSIVIEENRKGTKTTNESSVATAVGYLLGIKNTKSVSQTATLAELGMDSIVGTEIKQLLEKDYDLILSAQEIRGLTFQRLDNLNPSAISSSTTKFGKTYSPKNVGNLTKLTQRPHSEKRNVFFINFIETSLDPLRPLAELIEGAVFVLKYTEDCPKGSVEELARFYMGLMKTIQRQGPYLIVGYSFGSCLAFEIALQLETNGVTVEVVLLSEPDFYVPTCPVFYKGDVLAYQVEALINFASSHLNLMVDQVKLELDTLATLEEKAVHVATKLSRSSLQTTGDFRALITGLFGKISSMAEYKPSCMFHGSVTLIKPGKNSTSEDEDQLNLVCKRKVEVYLTGGDNEAPSVNEIANVINGITEGLYSRKQ